MWDLLEQAWKKEEKTKKSNLFPVLLRTLHPSPRCSTLFHWSFLLWAKDLHISVLGSLFKPMKQSLQRGLISLNPSSCPTLKTVQQSIHPQWSLLLLILWFLWCKLPFLGWKRLQNLKNGRFKEKFRRFLVDAVVWIALFIDFMAANVLFHNFPHDYVISNCHLCLQMQR